MDAFDVHRHVIADYADYTKSFVRIADERVRTRVEQELAQGLLWPEPLLQLNPAFEPGRSVDELVAEGVLHEECARIFRAKSHDNDLGRSMRLYLHQDQAIEVARKNRSYVLTTGTGSGKSLSYIIPIVNHVLNRGTGNGIQAVVVYPVNALANSQQEELDKFLKRGFGEDGPPVTYERYTGQEGEEARERIRKSPPDILLTNYVMLELILTRIEERQLVDHAQSLKFLVFDELHTYRGRQGADVAMLIRRCRESFQSKELLCVGTSATMATEGTSVQQSELVANVASAILQLKRHAMKHALTFFLTLLIVASASAAAQTFGANPLSDAVALWNFDDLNDSNGDNNRLEVVGDVPVGQSLHGRQFEESRKRGSDGKFAAFGKGMLTTTNGANDELHIRGQTMSFYLRIRDPKGWNGHGAIFHRGDWAYDFHSLNGREFRTQLFARHNNKRYDMRHTVPKGDIPDRSAWLDVVVVCDSAKLETYINGRCYDEDFMLGDFNPSAADLLIGGGLVAGKPSFTGPFHCDTVAVWNRALSRDEIVFLSGGKNAVDPRPRMDRGIPETVQYWKPANQYWVGDPLPFFHNGVFHFAYLIDRRHHRSKNVLGAHQWAQATSTDLVNWTHHPLTVPITDQWEGSICTGSFFHHEETYYAFFATRAADVSAPDGRTYKLRKQYPAYAISPDGFNFTKQKPNPLFILPEDVYGDACRDPVVIQNEDTGLFHMYLTSELNEKGPDGKSIPCLAHLTSNDLKNWELQNPVLTDRAPECPDLFKWGDLYYLITHWSNDEDYRIADSPDGPWRPVPNPGLRKLSPGVPHVPKSAEFTGNRRLLCSFTRGLGYAGYSVFHELKQAEDGSLYETFVPEMRPQTRPAIPLPEGFLGGTEEMAMDEFPKSCRIKLDLAFDQDLLEKAKADNKPCIFELRIEAVGDENGRKPFVFRVDPNNRRIMVDDWQKWWEKGRRNMLFRKDGATFDMYAVRNFVDIGFEEKQTFARLLPSGPHPFRLVIRPAGKAITVKSFEVLPIENPSMARANPSSSKTLP